MFPFCYPYTGYSQRQRQAPGQRRTRRHTGNEKTRRHTNHEKGDYSPQDSPFARSSVSIYCKPKGNKQQYHICVHQITCLSPCLLYCPAYLVKPLYLLFIVFEIHNILSSLFFNQAIGLSNNDADRHFFPNHL